MAAGSIEREQSLIIIYPCSLFASLCENAEKTIQARAIVNYIRNPPHESFVKISESFTA